MSSHQPHDPFAPKDYTPTTNNGSKRPTTASPRNLAVQRSLIDIFDEFTVIISGELKSMNLEEFKAETQKRTP